LDIFSAWANDWQMSISTSKCFTFRIGRGPTVVYSLCGALLACSSDPAVRDLGVLIDPALSFRPHVAAIVAKARRTAGLILRSFRNSDSSVLARAFVCYVRPMLEFGAPVFNGIPESASRQIERVQSWFTRRVFIRCHLPVPAYEIRLAKLGLDYLSARRRKLDLGFVHSVALGRHFCPHLPFHDPTSAYSLRHSNRLLSERNAKGARRKFIVNRVAAEWNGLPHCLKSLSKRSFAAGLSALLPAPSL
jgi:hypothetical protein